MKPAPTCRSTSRCRSARSRRRLPSRGRRRSSTCRRRRSGRCSTRDVLDQLPTSRTTATVGRGRARPQDDGADGRRDELDDRAAVRADPRQGRPREHHPGRGHRRRLDSRHPGPRATTTSPWPRKSPSRPTPPGPTCRAAASGSTWFPGKAATPSAATSSSAAALRTGRRTTSRPSSGRPAFRRPTTSDFMFDVNPRSAGDIVRDELWFFASGRLNHADLAPAGASYFVPAPGQHRRRARAPSRASTRPTPIISASE